MVVFAEVGGGEHVLDEGVTKKVLHEVAHALGDVRGEAHNAVGNDLLVFAEALRLDRW